jgi:hypothetical protein
MVLRHGLKLTILGVALGLAAAFGATRLIASPLFVSPTDGLTFAAISALLAAVAMLASAAPRMLRRACRQGVDRFSVSHGGSSAPARRRAKSIGDVRG